MTLCQISLMRPEGVRVSRDEECEQAVGGRRRSMGTDRAAVAGGPAPIPSPWSTPPGWSTGALCDPVCPSHRHPVAVSSAGTGLRFWDDVLETASRLERSRALATSARTPARRAASGRQARPLPGRRRLQPCPGDEGRAGHRSIPGGSRQDRQQAPHYRRGPRNTAGHDHHRRQSQRRNPADPTDRGRTADPRQAQPTATAAQAPVRRPRLRSRPTATGSAGSRPPLISPGAAPNTAPAWASTAGSSRARSRCCTGFDDCASAGRFATTSTMPSSHSAVPSSAGDG